MRKEAALTVRPFVRNTQDIPLFFQKKHGFRVFLIILPLFLLVGICYLYLFGELGYDRSFHGLSAEELGQVSPDEAVLVNPEPDTHTVLLPADEAEGELLSSVISDDILQQYYYHGAGTTLKRQFLEGADQIQVFMLYGIDDRNGDLNHATSDANMLVVLDRVHHKIKFIALSRDSYVYYPDFDSMTKLNYAYFFGGPKEAVHTLNANFFLNVSDYVVIRMSQMDQLVDMVGGVTVDLTQEEIDEQPIFRNMTPGKNLLDGEQATAYSRIRKIDNDTYRSGRQFQVIRSLISTIQNVKRIKYPSLIREALGSCFTSLSPTELLRLSSILFDPELEITHDYIPDANKTWSGSIDGHYYYVYDTLVASDEICKIIYEDLYESEFVTP